jgi:hypothetical protein
MIEHLPLLKPGSARGARTVSRCHDRLAARRRKLEARNRRATRGAAIAVERLLLAGVCVVCLITMAGNVLSIVLAI